MQRQCPAGHLGTVTSEGGVVGKIRRERPLGWAGGCVLKSLVGGATVTGLPFHLWTMCRRR